MSTIANVLFRLDSADTGMKLQRFALDAAAIKDAWKLLPADVRLANEQMQRLAQTQIRVGHLQGRDRDAYALHQERVLRFQERLTQQITVARAAADQNPLMGWYSAVQAQGTRAQWKNAMADPAFAALHEQMQGLGALGSQMAALQAGSALVGDTGAGRGGWGQAARYWGKRAAFGTGPDGTPMGAGDWAKEKIVGGAHWLRHKANQVASLFAVFEGLRMVQRSMSAFEAQADTVQALGAQLGGNFQGVSSKLKALREDYKLTLSDVRSGMGTFAEATGTLAGTDAAVRFARATGLDPNAMLGRFGRMGIFGRVDADAVERAMQFSGMSSRPAAFIDWMSQTVANLGQGMLEVPTVDAASFVGLISRAMGPAFANERGAQLTQRLIGGMRGGGGTDPVSAARMHAVRGIGRMNLGTAENPEWINTRTYRGMQAALESGKPEVLEALYRESVRLGGAGEMGRSAFQALAGRGLNTFESDRVFKSLAGHRGRMPGLEVLSGTNLDNQLAAVRGTTAYEHQRIASEMETGVYEPIGEKLKPIALDFQEAGKRLGARLANATDAISMATELLAGIGEAANYLRNDANSASRAIFEFSLLGGPFASVIAKQAIIAAGQAGAAATGGVSTGQKRQ